MPEYDAITPSQWVLFLWAALIIFSILWWLFWRSGRTEAVVRDEAGPAEIVLRAISAALHWRPSHMSTSDDVSVDPVSGTEVVHVPVLRTSSADGTSSEQQGGIDVNIPDTNAVNTGTNDTETPRLSLRLSDTETISLLAAQRGKDGKHRYSANQIHGLVGGSRASVLAQVKALRDGTPNVFPALTPEQQQLREQLQLDQR